MPKYKEQFGRPCPHVGLLDINGDASQLVILALNEHTQPLISAHLGTMDPETMREALNRAIIVLASKELSDMLEKAEEKRAKEKAVKHARHSKPRRKR